MSFLSLFKLPIVRHSVAGLIVLGVGFYFGTSFLDKKLKRQKENTEIAKLEASAIKGKYEELKLSTDALRVQIDTLQSVIFELANKEHYKIDNHITDTKVKRGGKIDFSPESTIIKSDSISSKRWWQVWKKNRSPPN